MAIGGGYPNTISVQYEMWYNIYRKVRCYNMNNISLEMERKLEEELLHKRYESKEELQKKLINVLGFDKEIKLEDSTNEDNLNLDYEVLVGIETEDNYYYITIYYLKTRNDEMYITEVSVDNE